MKRLNENRPMGSDAYAVEYRNFPKHLLRYIPGAIKTVRKDDSLKELEKQDKKAFRHEVAFKAFETNKLSNQDLGSVGDVSDMASQAQGGPPVKEDHDFDTRPDNKVPATHIRIFKTLDEGYYVRMGPRTYNLASLGSVMTTLVSEGVRFKDVEQLLSHVERTGEATYITTHYEPSEVE